MKIKWRNVTIFVIILAVMGMLGGFFWAKFSAPTPETPKDPIKQVDHREESKRVEQILRKFFEQNPKWNPGESGQKIAKDNLRTWYVDPKTDEKSKAIAQLIEFMKQNNVYTTEPVADEVAKTTFVELGYKYDGDKIKITDKVIFQGIADIAKKKHAVKGKLAIIVDDTGNSVDTLKRMLEIDAKVTFAILPSASNAQDSLQMLKDAGRPAMLHLPMQAMSSAAAAERNTIMTTMSNTEIANTTAAAVDTLPGIIGVNNHQGSKATSDERVMRSVLTVLKNRGLYFVDSATIGSSVAYRLAGEMGVPTAKNNGFLDNSSDPSEIKQKFLQAAKLALKNGSAIYICHVRPNTAVAMREAVPEVKALGVEFVYVSELLH